MIESVAKAKIGGIAATNMNENQPSSINQLQEIDVVRWEEFEDKLAKLRIESRNTSEMWFRGQELSWSLTTTLERKTPGSFVQRLLSADSSGETAD